MNRNRNRLLSAFLLIALLQTGLYSSIVVRHHNILQKGEAFVFIWGDVYLPDPQPGQRITVGEATIVLGWPAEVPLPEPWQDTPPLYLLFEAGTNAAGNPVISYASETPPRHADAFLKARLRHIVRPDESIGAGLLLPELRPGINSITLQNTSQEKSAPETYEDASERRFREELWQARLQLKIYRGTYAVVFLELTR
ncbi:MAG: hypothetical protein LAT75_15035 [Candidatus Cyclonatronum sp.]|uniref:hypothetical protein n=1 Tax=Cyclonatronum sp. TaxID=3024185 RepID=UPI0025C507DF|nr:hypothetical protein [Cyclonatronum sp.]MCH8488176.1 hypothetical protein [Cyclonatronum sp.]